MKIFKTFYSIIFIIPILIISCVPARQFEELKAKEKKCNKDLTQSKSDNQMLKEQNTELNAQNEILSKKIKNLVMDTTELGNTLRLLTKNYHELNKTYEALLRNNAKLLSENSSETQKIIERLNIAQENLQKKEDELKLLEQNLQTKRLEYQDITNKLNDIQKDNKKKEAKLLELQNMLSKKDSTVAALKTKVSNALLGFENKGLSVTQKNGKIYVSLEESLLFQTGSITVDSKGVEALKKLAKVLEKNEDIHILIEGHTDNVPYKNAVGGIKDNWDLSVLRATSIIRILTANANINPKILTAAGKGEYSPINPENTKEARAQNRRTEIIITPKLDDLLKIIETN
jgi:chemotaxis protein MotB